MSAATLDWAVPFDALRVGDRFATPERTLTEADVHAFAALTGDHHPQHLDAAWAARSPFGERIAHGLLVVSAAAGLVGFDPARVVALRALREVVFKRPVRLGEAIAVDGKVVALTAVDDEVGLVGLAWRVLGEGGRLACRAHVDVLWRAGAET